MSIIFQLFSTEDLKKLTPGELLGLRNKIAGTLVAAGLSKDGKLHLNLRPKTELDEEIAKPLRSLDSKWEILFQTWRNFAQKALFKRFYEVSHQMKTPPLDISQPGFHFNQLKGDRKTQNTVDQEEQILEWAISCELNHLEFYFALLVAKQAADDFFDENLLIKERFLPAEQRKNPINAKIRYKDPDSVYSPFNPRYPGNKEYSNFSRSGPGTTGPTTYSAS